MKKIILLCCFLFLTGCINTAYFTTDPGLRYFRTGDDLTLYVIYKDGGEQIDWEGVAKVLEVVEKNCEVIKKSE